MQTNRRVVLFSERTRRVGSTRSGRVIFSIEATTRKERVRSGGDTGLDPELLVSGSGEQAAAPSDDAA